MAKTLTLTAVAAGIMLAFSAVAAENKPLQAAPAYTAEQTKGVVIWNDENTSVGLLGSVRLYAKTDSKNTQSHNIQNNDTRFGVAIRHNLDAYGNYAAGYFETGMHGFDSATSDQGNDLYTRQAYVGVGNSDMGVVTFGKQYAPTDWGLGIDTTYAWGGKSKHDKSGMSTDIVNSSAVYYYNDNNLTFGVMGQGNDTVDGIEFANYGDGGPNLQDAYRDGAATVHGGAVAALQYRWDNGFSVSGALGWNNYSVDGGNSSVCTAVSANTCIPMTISTGPAYDGQTYSSGLNLKYTTDIGGMAWYNGAQVTYYVNEVDDVLAASGSSHTDDSESVMGLEYNSQLKLTPEWSIYADFSWLQGGGAMDGQYFQSTVLGTDYWIGSHAVTYIEYSYQKSWGHVDESFNIDDHLAAVGLRVYL
ncbi:MAG: porin [Scandinavium sp.]|uniref:porin n=1 Tax=Scandinavium sp. TaxID=2830653 RepID=UPI003F374D65